MPPKIPHRTTPIIVSLWSRDSPIFNGLTDESPPSAGEKPPCLPSSRRSRRTTASFFAKPALAGAELAGTSTPTHRHARQTKRGHLTSLVMLRKLAPKPRRRFGGAGDGHGRGVLHLWQLRRARDGLQLRLRTPVVHREIPRSRNPARASHPSRGNRRAPNQQLRVGYVEFASRPLCCENCVAGALVVTP